MVRFALQVRQCQRRLPVMLLPLFIVASALAIPSAAQAVTWTIDQTPTLSGTSSAVLYGISCSSARQCAAVGAYSQFTPQAGFAEVWDGTSWSPQDATAFDDGGSALLGVSCPAFDNCSGVGFDQILGGPLLPTAQQGPGGWGSENAAAPSTPPGADHDDSRLLSVSCSAPTACTAVGTDLTRDEPLVERWDGTSWQIQNTPVTTVLQDGGGGLADVSCPTARSCTAVGGAGDSPLIEHWNGSRWSIENTAVPANTQSSTLNAIACVSALRCTAVGSADGNSNTPTTLAERRGVRGVWLVEPTPTPPNVSSVSLAAVSCRRLAGCTAVGNYQTTSGTIATLAEGQSWFGGWRNEDTPMPPGATDAQLDGVACTGFRRCFAAGYSSNATTGVSSPLIEHSAPGWEGVGGT